MLKFLFTLVSTIGLITSLACFVIIIIFQNKAKECPDDDSLKNHIANADIISRWALFFTAVFYFLFKFFGGI